MICESYAAQNETTLVSVLPSKRPRTADLMGLGTVAVVSQGKTRLKPPQ